MGTILFPGWPLWPGSFPGHFSHHVLLSSAGVSLLSGDGCPSERTGLVRAAGSAGVPLKSLLSGKRADVVPALPSGCGRKSISSFPWAYPEAENCVARPGCVPRLGGRGEAGMVAGVCGDRGGPDAALGWLALPPLTPAAQRLHLPQPHLAALASQSSVPPDSRRCPGPITGQSLRDPCPPPSFFQGSLLGGRAQLRAIFLLPPSRWLRLPRSLNQKRPSHLQGSS